MNKVYELLTDLENYAYFIEQYDHVDNMFIRKYWQWKHIDLNTYQPVQFNLFGTQTGKKNYQFDISTPMGLIIFSEKAIEVLKPILEQTGQIVPIITPSKRKQFFGFYPNNCIYSETIINLAKSDFSQYEKGKVFNKIVLNSTYPKNDYIFVIENEGMYVFVTEKFKQLVEQHNLKGFRFEQYNTIPVID